MSVESEILRIQRNVADAYAAVAEMGGNIPVAAELNSGNLAAAVRSIPSIAGLKTDDTLTETDGTLGVTAPVQGVLSQEEFDALPEEQRNKGLYVIPGEGGGDTQEPEGEVYSTEERVIGRWVDGRPLYCRAAQVSFPSLTNDFAQKAISFDTEGLVFVENNAIWINDDYDSTRPTTKCFLSNATVSVRSDGAYVSIGNGMTNKIISVIVKYIKTTDTEVTA